MSENFNPPVTVLRKPDKLTARQSNINTVTNGFDPQVVNVGNWVVTDAIGRQEVYTDDQFKMLFYKEES